MSIKGWSYGKLKAVAVSPRDAYQSCTVPVQTWLAANIERHDEYIRAVALYVSHPWYDGSLRDDPRVAYDAGNDDSYFIFKQDNNGTTILVGYSLPSMHSGDVMSETYVSEVER